MAQAPLSWRRHIVDSRVSTSALSPRPSLLHQSTTAYTPTLISSAVEKPKLPRSENPDKQPPCPGSAAARSLRSTTRNGTILPRPGLFSLSYPSYLSPGGRPPPSRATLTQTKVPPLPALAHPKRPHPDLDHRPPLLRLARHPRRLRPPRAPPRRPLHLHLHRLLRRRRRAHARHRAPRQRLPARARRRRRSRGHQGGDLCDDGPVP